MVTKYKKEMWGGERNHLKKCKWMQGIQGAGPWAKKRKEERSSRVGEKE